MLLLILKLRLQGNRRAKLFSSPVVIEQRLTKSLMMSTQNRQSVEKRSLDAFKIFWMQCISQLVEFFYTVVYEFSN